jgi:2-hydroxychromene-2-carboxylate isomerase
MSTVDVFLDPISPYAWFAGRQLDRLDAAGAHVIVHPVLLAALLDHHGNVGPAEVPSKRVHAFRDVVRTASALGLPLEGPPAHPFNPLLALRVASAVDDDDARRALMVALMDAAWAEGRDLERREVVSEVAARVGLDGAQLLERASDPAIKQRLRERTEDAIARGVFGVPSFVIEGEIFWGSDRIDALLRRLAGSRTDEDKLARMLARPASATRR